MANLTKILQGAKSIADDAAKATPRALDDLPFKHDVAQRGFMDPSYTPATPTDIAYEIYVNNLLSSPPTHALNFVSNSANAALSFGDTLTKVALSPFYAPENRVHVSQVAGDIYGTLHGIITGLKFAGKTARHNFLRTGKTELEVADELQIPDGILVANKMEHMNRALSAKNLSVEEHKILAPLVNGLGSLINLPVSTLNSTDLFFKVLETSRTRGRLAAQRASTEGVDFGTAWRAMADDDAFARAAVANAEHATYMGRPNIPILSWITDAAPEKLPGMRWVIPFKRAIANILEQSVERSPLVLANPTMARRLISADPAVRLAAQSRLVTGVATLTALAYVLDGRLTGPAPRGALNRAMFEQVNGAEFSVYTGMDPNDPTGQIKLDSLGTMGQLLKVVAMYQQYLNTASDEELGIVSETEQMIEFLDNPKAAQFLKTLGEWVEPVATMMEDNFWGSQVAQLINAVEQTKEAGNPFALSRYFEEMASHVFPGFGAIGYQQWVQRQDMARGEGGVKMPSTIPGTIFAKFEQSARDKLYDDYDINGNFIIPSRLRQIDSPVTPYDPKDKLTKEYLDLKIQFNRRSPGFNTEVLVGSQGTYVPMTHDEWTDMHTVIREGAKKTSVDLFGKKVEEPWIPPFKEFMNTWYFRMRLKDHPKVIRRKSLIEAKEEYNELLKSYMIAEHPTYSAKYHEASVREQEKARGLIDQLKTNLSGVPQ